jgi:hypothetical protein
MTVVAADNGGWAGLTPPPGGSVFNYSVTGYIILSNRSAEPVDFDLQLQMGYNPATFISTTIDHLWIAGNGLIRIPFLGIEKGLLAASMFAAFWLSVQPQQAPLDCLSVGYICSEHD